MSFDLGEWNSSYMPIIFSIIGIGYAVYLIVTFRRELAQLYDIPNLKSLQFLYLIISLCRRTTIGFFALFFIYGVLRFNLTLITQSIIVMNIVFPIVDIAGLLCLPRRSRLVPTEDIIRERVKLSKKEMQLSIDWYSFLFSLIFVYAIVTNVFSGYFNNLVLTMIFIYLWFYYHFRKGIERVMNHKGNNF